MRFVSLFAGVGGFDLGFERAGMDSVGQVEIDAKCREVLAQHWPDVPRFEDVHEVTASDLYGLERSHKPRNMPDIECRPAMGDTPKHGNLHSLLATGGTDGIGSVDVLVGGFPCQDYSVAGRRGGLAGDRGALWWQFHRLADECRPEWVVGENVPGLLSSNDGRDFGTIVGSLVELGYGVVWRVLDAQYFGVAQRRRRVFIVGHSGGEPRPEVLAFAEGVSGDSAPRREAGKDVAPTLGSRTKGGGGLGTDAELDGALISTGKGFWRESDIAATLSQRDWKEGTTVAFNWQATGDWDTPHEEYPDALHAGQTPAVAVQGTTIGRTDKAGPGGKGWSDDGSMFTLETIAPHGVAHQSSVRRLTPLECERLQGFPDGWTASQSDTQRYRQMGNAVAVPVAEWVGRQLVKAE